MLHGALFEHMLSAPLVVPVGTDRHVFFDFCCLCTLLSVSWSCQGGPVLNNCTSL